jgi:hypothetical protein
MNIRLDDIDISILLNLWNSKSSTSYNLTKTIFPKIETKNLKDKESYIKKKLNKLIKFGFVKTRKVAFKNSKKNVYSLIKEKCFVGTGRLLFKSEVSNQEIPIEMGRILVINSEGNLIYIQLGGEKGASNIKG